MNGKVARWQNDDSGSFWVPPLHQALLRHLAVITHTFCHQPAQQLCEAGDTMPSLREKTEILDAHGTSSFFNLRSGGSDAFSLRLFLWKDPASSQSLSCPWLYHESWHPQV